TMLDDQKGHLVSRSSFAHASRSPPNLQPPCRIPHLVSVPSPEPDERGAAMDRLQATFQRRRVVSSKRPISPPYDLPPHVLAARVTGTGQTSEEVSPERAERSLLSGSKCERTQRDRLALTFSYRTYANGRSTGWEFTSVRVRHRRRAPLLRTQPEPLQRRKPRRRRGFLLLVCFCARQSDQDWRGAGWSNGRLSSR